MLESTLSAKIVKKLNEIPLAKIRKRHAGPWRKGLADLTGSINGQHVEIEVKLPGNLPTRIQLVQLERWAKSRAITALSYSVEQAQEVVSDGLGGNIAPPSKWREMLDKGQYKK